MSTDVDERNAAIITAAPEMYALLVKLSVLIHIGDGSPAEIAALIDPVIATIDGETPAATTPSRIHLAVQALDLIEHSSHEHYARTVSAVVKRIVNGAKAIDWDSTGNDDRDAELKEWAEGVECKLRLWKAGEERT